MNLKLNERYVGYFGMVLTVVLAFTLRSARWKTLVLPGFCLACLFLLSLVLAVRGRKANAEEAENKHYEIKDIPMVLKTLVLTALYIALFRPLGFLISTFLFLFAYQFITGYKSKLWVKLLWATWFPIAAYLIFKTGFSVRLPTLFL